MKPSTARDAIGYAVGRGLYIGLVALVAALVVSSPVALVAAAYWLL